jgi:hypothetical protein
MARGGKGPLFGKFAGLSERISRRKGAVAETSPRGLLVKIQIFCPCPSDLSVVFLFFH